MEVRDLVEIRHGERSKRVQALFDTGSRLTCVSEEIAEELGYERFGMPKRVALAVRGKEAELTGEIKGARITITGYEMPLSETVGVVKGLREQMVVGMPFMEMYEIRLDPERGKPYLVKRPPELHLF